ncbi:hypothetical protein [Streptomyces sp. AA0539]|uniref:hypothetical protein n=1 Tax=Streptomyces sp. AA0539 TaxID=1210045 RepID=UPI0002D541E3|nr:hypothetical protein [Streptomyces sp. AA0539]
MTTPAHHTVHRTDRPTAEQPLVIHQPPGALTPQQAALLLALNQQHAPVAPAAPVPAPVDTRVSGKAKDIALITAGGGAGVGAATTGIGYGSGLIASASGGLMTAALALAITTGSIGALLLMLRTTRKTTTAPDEGSADRQPVQHITQNITAPGMFGRANGTINGR